MNQKSEPETLNEWLSQEKLEILIREKTWWDQTTKALKNVWASDAKEKVMIHFDKDKWLKYKNVECKILKGEKLVSSWTYSSAIGYEDQDDHEIKRKLKEVGILSNAWFQVLDTLRGYDAQLELSSKGMKWTQEELEELEKRHQTKGWEREESLSQGVGLRNMKVKR